MIKIVAHVSDFTEEPLAPQGVKIFTKQNPAPKEEILALEGKYDVMSIYKYDHSGIALSFAPNSCGWDTSYYGIMAVPKDFFAQDKKDEGFKSLLTEHNQWLENEIYDFTFCLTESDKEFKEFPSVDQFLLSELDIYQLLEVKFPPLMDFIKRNKLSKSYVNLTTDELKPFLDLYAGSNVFGPILKSEIMSTWVLNCYGSAYTDKLIEDSVPVAEAFSSYVKESKNFAEYSIEDLILNNSKEDSLKILKRSEDDY